MNKPSLYETEIFRTVTHSPIVLNGEQFNLSSYPYLDIVLTDYCNSRCKFCIADLLEEKLVCNPDTFKQQITYAYEDLGVKEVLLLGGEPTVSMHLFDIILYLRAFDFNKICITTNGKRCKDEEYARKLMSSGITHMNVSFMSVDAEAQNFVHGAKNNMTLEELKKLYEISCEYGVHLRVNNNVYKTNNSTYESLMAFYEAVKDSCDSIKFSPLLKTDSFSVIPEVNNFNRFYMLDDEHYEGLFNGVVESFESDYPIVKNENVFGFVEYKMICLPTPIIFNYNHRGRMMKQATECKQINNIKLLPNGNLSRSWNRDELHHVIRFGDA